MLITAYDIGGERSYRAKAPDGSRTAIFIRQDLSAGGFSDSHWSTFSDPLMTDFLRFPAPGPT